MDNFVLILSYCQQLSIILGGILLLYWRVFREEGKNFWSVVKIKNLSGGILNEEEEKINASNLREFVNVIKNGSKLLKCWLMLFGVYFLSFFITLIIAITK